MFLYTVSTHSTYNETELSTEQAIQVVNKAVKRKYLRNMIIHTLTKKAFLALSILFEYDT